MNYCGIQQSRDEMLSFVACPKPRRVVNDPSRPLRWPFGHQTELSDSRAGSELLDIILIKGGQGVERPSSQVASSPPFFCGSPPSRVSNPLIQDARFREEKQLIPPFSPLQPMSIPCSSGSGSSPNSSARKVSCIRANFGNNPAVRVEGFDCLDRDRRNCSITAHA